MRLEALIPGKPYPKGSPRPLRLGNGKTILTAYASRAAEAWAKHALNHCLASAPERPLTGALRCRAWFTLPRPKTNKREFPDVRGSGDTEKYCRTLFDVLESAGWMRDDAQIVAVEALKQYPVELDGEPHTRVQLEPYLPGGEA